MYSFSLATSQKDMCAAFKLRYKVYCLEKSWLNPTNYPDEQESDMHDDRSLIFIARDDITGKLAGTVRLIINETDRIRLPICEHPSFDQKFNTAKSMEISRFSIAQEARSGEVYIGLIRMMFRCVVRDYPDYENVFFGVEPRFLTVVNKLGFEFRPVAPEAFWFGDYIVPSCQPTASLDISVRRNNPAYHRWLWKNPEKMETHERMISFLKSGKHDKLVKTKGSC